MISCDAKAWIEVMNAFPPEGIGVLSFFFCMASILTLFRLFGEPGLVLYSVVGLVAANLQVLKAGQYCFYEQPVALGTLVFSSTFLVMDMLTEHYGAQAARRAILLSFSGCLLLTLLMFFSLGVRPLSMGQDSLYAGFNRAHEAISVLFLPAPAIFVASLISYLISQYTDIALYQGIKNLMHSRALWMRTLLSNMVASFLDNAIFSTLAWVVFAPSPVTGKTLLYSYILGPYSFRLALSFFQMPVMYLSRFVKQENGFRHLRTSLKKLIISCCYRFSKEAV